MKKKKPKLCPALVPNKKKEMLKIVQDPIAMKNLIELQHAASNVMEKQSSLKAADLQDWLERVENILPDFKDKENMIIDLKNLVEKYVVSFEEEIFN